MMTPPPMRRGDELLMEISEAAFEGKCVARLENFVVFVEDAVPGDRGLVRISAVKKTFAEGRLVRIDFPSSLRGEPRCRYVGVCGGCKWQHVQYEAQLRFKEQQLRDALERIGGFKDPVVLPIIGASKQFMYRGKMEFSFMSRQWMHSGAEPSDSTVFVGLHVPQRYDKVLDITECHLQSEISNRILNFSRTYARTNGLTVYDTDRAGGYLRFLVIRESKKTGEVMVNIVTSSDDPDCMRAYADALAGELPEVTTIVNTINETKAQIAFGQKERIYRGSGMIREELGSLHFNVSASSFFQTNVAQAEQLYRVAKEFAGLEPSDVVYDLYSGTGTIALYVANAVKTVVGIESVESAVRDAERNASENGIPNCIFVQGDLKDRLAKNTEWMKSVQPPDVLIIDPPRSGMHPKVVQEVSTLGAKRIVYVSCNPSTQARDLKDLCASSYRLVRSQPVDMFPHTYHIENVALVERVG
jgi:23S rRNA (uracil1939-C5)-methyltransferase